MEDRCPDTLMYDYLQHSSGERNQGGQQLDEHEWPPLPAASNNQYIEAMKQQDNCCRPRRRTHLPPGRTTWVTVKPPSMKLAASQLTLKLNQSLVEQSLQVLDCTLNRIAGQDKGLPAVALMNHSKFNVQVARGQRIGEWKCSQQQQQPQTAGPGQQEIQVRGQLAGQRWQATER